MPAWTPNWNLVEIDEIGLLDAAADCFAAIAMIEEAHGALGPSVVSAQDGWEGPARLDFDDDYASFERQIGAVISQLQQAAMGFQRQVADAHEEQARRFAQQEQWLQEDAAERERDALNRATANREAANRAAANRESANRESASREARSAVEDPYGDAARTTTSVPTLSF